MPVNKFYVSMHSNKIYVNKLMIDLLLRNIVKEKGIVKIINQYINETD